jgi:hypothetical protein
MSDITGFRSADFRALQRRLVPRKAYPEKREAACDSEISRARLHNSQCCTECSDDSAPKQRRTECNAECSAGEKECQQVYETALTQTEPTLEKIKNVNANKMVIAAREANGRFGNRGLALANDTAKRIAKVAYTPDETGRTMVEQVAASQLIVARDNKDPRNLNAVAGLIETLDEITGQKLVRQKMARETENKNPVAKVEITIKLADPNVIDWDAKVKADTERSRKGPSDQFLIANAEVVQQNPPSGLDTV